MLYLYVVPVPDESKKRLLLLVDFNGWSLTVNNYARRWGYFALVLFFFFKELILPAFREAFITALNKMESIHLLNFVTNGVSIKYSVFLSYIYFCQFLWCFENWAPVSSLLQKLLDSELENWEGFQNGVHDIKVSAWMKSWWIMLRKGLACYLYRLNVLWGF